MDNHTITPDPQASEGGLASERGLTSKRGLARRLPAILAAVLALALCLALVYTLAGATGPRESLERVLAATAKAGAKTQAAWQRDIPALGLLAGHRALEARGADTVLTFVGVEGTAASREITALLGGAQLRIEAETSPTAAQAGVVLEMLGRQYGGLYAYGDPQTLALGLPGLTETVLSADMGSLVADFAASPWYDPAAQQGLEAFAQAWQQAWGRHQARAGQAVPSEYRACWDTLLDAGDYTRSAEGYTVRLPGEAVQAFVLDTLWLAVGDRLLAEGIAQEDYDAEGLEAVPALPVTAVFEVSSRGILTYFDISAPVFAVPEAEAYEATLVLRGAVREGVVTEVMLNATWLDRAGAPYGFRVNWHQGVVENNPGTYWAGGVLLWLDDGYTRWQGDLDLRVDTQGTLTASLDFGADGGAALSLAAQGTIAAQGQRVMIDLPHIGLSATDAHTDAALTFRLAQTLRPLSGPVSPSRAFTPLFSLSEAELEALARELVTALEALLRGDFGTHYGT